MILNVIYLSLIITFACILFINIINDEKTNILYKLCFNIISKQKEI